MAKTEITHLSAATDAAMLRDAAEFVKRGWTRAYSGRDKDGDGIGYDQPEAVCFCTQGAVYRAVMDGLGGDPRVIYTNLFEETTNRLSRYVVDALDRIDDQTCPVWQKPDSEEKPEYMIIEWNDRWARHKDDVVAVLEKAATLAAATADTTEDETT